MDMLGWRISKGITDRGFGACIVDDDRYDYYVVQWDGTPKQATKTKTIRIEEEDFPVRKGEWICYGREEQTSGGTRRNRNVLLDCRLFVTPALISYHMTSKPTN